MIKVVDVNDQCLTLNRKPALEDERDLLADRRNAFLALRHETEPFSTSLSAEHDRMPEVRLSLQPQDTAGNGTASGLRGTIDRSVIRE